MRLPAFLSMALLCAGLAAAPSLHAQSARPAAKPAGPAAAKPAVAKPAVSKPPAAKPATMPPPPAGLGSADQDLRYKNGKILVEQGRYAMAMQELEPLTLATAKFGRAPEAAYLYAVAASRTKKWAEAEQMLNLLRNRYPSWSGLPEALFLQGQISFEQQDYPNALAVLSELPTNTLTSERATMEAMYLPRISEKAVFQNLVKNFPQDAALGRAYADKLVSGGWYTPADQAQLDQLISRFSLDRNTYTPRPGGTKKSSYNIGVLLPFEFGDTSWEKRRRNQFITDLYAGLRLAQDSLQRAGRPVQLFAYDTGADTVQLKQVLTLPELAGMDLIIGPIYKSGSKILAQYAQQHQIAVVNPLSQDGSLVTDNAWHYLFEPGTATQARQAAQFAYTRLGGPRTAVVLYEDTNDETAFGLAYKQAYEALGGKVLQLRRIKSDDETSLAAGFGGIDLKTVGHLVVASDNPKSGVFTLSAMRVQSARPPLITYASWLNNNRLSLDQLDSRDIYFIHPKYLDRNNAGVRRVRQLYIQQLNLPPSVFAYTGFELLYYFGSQLHQHGPSFQQPLANGGPVSGAVFQGIGYPNGAHDNQYVPITKLERLEVEVLNPVGFR
ncbi:ABC transporter substrate-binding protein [Hymenobacter sp. P5342]|uniref:ABC transporter substrate-binding protein n=2 Tax=Hymenobacter lapidiphilus TaxID=2608003 RepID=A0A7Y7PLH3_9BACT|nr:ABC transporter substrate-binding protein [Hymenobacter lapidiphilus]NVO30021.1 ABC transporter substrate-binding protein [Hymenobacter lapidiphilus]